MEAIVVVLRNCIPANVFGALPVVLIILASPLTCVLEVYAQTMKGFVLYQMTVQCENSTTPSKIFTHKNIVGGTPGRPLMGTHSFCVGRCREGKVRLADQLAKLPAHIATAFQQDIDNYEGEAACGKGVSIAECLETPRPKYTTPNGTFAAAPWNKGPEMIPSSDSCPGCLWELVTVDLTYHLLIADGEGSLPPMYNPPKKISCDYRYLSVRRCPVNQKVTTRVETKNVPGQCPDAPVQW